MINQALTLALRGFHVFPVKAGAKMPPLIKDFPSAASRDAGQLRSWWGNWPDANIGISTSQFGDDEALLVVDVDNKGTKNGDATTLQFELDGFEFPDTYTQSTPSGGRHLVTEFQLQLARASKKLEQDWTSAVEAATSLLPEACSLPVFTKMPAVVLQMRPNGSSADLVLTLEPTGPELAVRRPSSTKTPLSLEPETTSPTTRR